MPSHLKSIAVLLAILLGASVVGACRRAEHLATPPPASPGTAPAPTANGPPPIAQPTTPDASAAPGATGQPATPQATSEPEITLPPVVDPQGSLSWSLQPPGQYVVADTVSAATAAVDGPLAGQLFAVGSTDEGDSGAAAAWRSTDGRSWQRVDLPGSGDAALQSVAHGPAGVVAVGFSYAGDQPVPAGWHSTDGQAWQPIGGDLGFGEMGAVVGTADGFLALGADPDSGEVLAWSSADGRAWSVGSPAGGIEDGATFNGMVAIEGGSLAFGATEEGAAALWHSADGFAWTRSTLSGPASSAVNDVLAAPALPIVAVGAAYEEEFATVLAWTSHDGLAWEPSASGSVDGEPFSVARWGSGFVAVGAVDLARFRFDAAVWRSQDGRSWQRAPDGEGFRQARMYELLALGNELVAVGERGLDELAEELEPAIWVGQGE